jgi:hypothetical protein
MGRKSSARVLSRHEIRNKSEPQNDSSKNTRETSPASEINFRRPVCDWRVFDYATLSAHYKSRVAAAPFIGTKQPTPACLDELLQITRAQH